MTRESPWQIRGPYTDGTFALIEKVGTDFMSRGMFKSRGEARGRHREILAKRKAEEGTTKCPG